MANLASGDGQTLEARQVTVRFEGLTAVDAVDETLHKGEILGLIGQSVQYMGQFAGNNELMFAGLVINLFWVFGVMLRLYFGILYLVDQELGPIEALQASWEATRGQGFKLIGLALASAAVARRETRSRASAATDAGSRPATTQPT